MRHMFRSLRKRNFRLLVLHIGCKSVQQPQAHAAVSQFFLASEFWYDRWQCRGKKLPEIVTFVLIRGSAPESSTD